MLVDKTYPVVGKPAKKSVYPHAAVWALPLSDDERAAAIAGFRALGYPLAPEGGAPDVANAVPIKAFQRDHGLTVDGIIGRATLATLQRRLNAKEMAVPAVGAPAVAATGSASGAWDVLGSGAVPDGLVLASAGAFTLWAAWRYRDVIATKLQHRLPRVAKVLRSI
jgi:lysozyme